MTVDADLAAIAAFGLQGSVARAVGPVDDEVFARILIGAQRHRLTGLVGAAVQAGALSTTPEQQALLEHELQAWLAHALRAEALVLAATDALNVAGIEFRILKGVALAHTVYPDPAWRVFGDADLLVPHDALTRAAEILVKALPLVREIPELRPGFDDRFGKEVLLRTDRGLELDVHRTLVEGAMGLRVHLPDLFAPPSVMVLGGHRLAILPPPAQLMSSAFAAILGDSPPRLMVLRDVVQVLGVLDPGPDAVLALARRWRAEAVLARALTTAWDVLRPTTQPALVAWALAYRPGRLDRLLLRAHTGPGRAYAAQAAGLLVAPGVRGRAAYLRALAWPQRAYLEARGYGRVQFARRAFGR